MNILFPRREIDELVDSVLQNRKISQTELADIFGVRPETISRWMNSHTAPSRAEVFYLEHLERSSSPKSELGIVIPIYCNIPDNPDFDAADDKLGEIVCPAWLAGDHSDFYALQVPGSRDLAIIRPRTKFSPGDHVVVKVNGTFELREVDALHCGFPLEVKGVAAVILKVL